MEKEEIGQIPAPFAVVIYFCNCFCSTLCSSLSSWPPMLPAKYPPYPHTLYSLWERAENRTWRRDSVVRIKAGKMLTSPCCGQHRLDLEKFKLILLVCCVFPLIWHWPSSHSFFVLSTSLFLVNTPSKKCHECDWRARLCPVVGLGCVWHGHPWPFLSEAAPAAPLSARLLGTCTWHKNLT